MTTTAPACAIPEPESSVPEAELIARAVEQRSEGRDVLVLLSPRSFQQNPYALRMPRAWTSISGFSAAGFGFVGVDREGVVIAPAGVGHVVLAATE